MASPSLLHRLFARLQPLTARLPANAREYLLTILLAGVASAGTIAFMLVLNYLFDLFYLRQALQGDPWRFAGISFAAITGASLFSGWLLFRYAPKAAGSGVPDVKAAFWKELGFLEFRPVWVKFVAGTVGIGGGLSLGREGPSVFLGAGLSSCLAGLFGAPRRARRSALIIGSSAALAAAFNAPIAAIAFALEEVIKDFSSRLLGRTMLAALVGALCVHAAVGAQPAFSLPEIAEPHFLIYPLVCLVSLGAALAGVAFQQGTLYLRPRLRAQTKIPRWLLPTVGGWIAWALGVGVYLLTGKVAVFGLGYHDLSEALQHDLAFHVALALLVTKLASTVICYATGGCGGIFSPTLFLGAMAGFVIGGAMGDWFGLTHSEKILLAAVGMCGCFGATVRAPWSALMIVFEMTHDFSMIPALLLCTFIAQGTARLFGSQNFYDAVLEQDGHVLHTVAPPRTLNDWQDLHLYTIANKRPVVLRDWSPEAVRKLLGAYPYQRFPAVRDGKAFIAAREELEAALAEGREPAPREAVVARPDQAIREISEMFMRTPFGMILLGDPESGEIVGLLTLHDILRAQAALQE